MSLSWKSGTLPSALLGLALAVALSQGACSGEFTIDRPIGSGDPVGGADASVSLPGDGASFFNQNILPLLSTPRPLGSCALCHQGANAADGPDFLGLNAQGNYAGLLNTPGLIGDTAAQSRFYTKGAHAGDAFPGGDLELISEWILLEAQ